MLIKYKAKKYVHYLEEKNIIAMSNCIACDIVYRK